MLTLDDCIALCDLSEDEVLAIAAHENLPELAAAELGSYLVHDPDGELCIKAMIRDDIDAAERAGEANRALALKLILREYVARHPRCEARHRNALRLPERRRD
ncbi:MAG: hypothetical protein O2975_01615 [Proteobacteria bacterium]|nr:hypothetical protein [Pseudomonadota bacterium]